MSKLRHFCTGLLLFGAGLHSFTHVIQADHFSPAFWLWSLLPYLLGLVLLRFISPPAWLAGLLPVALIDCAMYYSVFIAPQGSTAAVGLVIAPAWNLIVMFIGMIVGTVIVRSRNRRYSP